MDGFRDRMGRGSSDRYDRYDDSRYDRSERGSRRSSYAGASSGASSDEIANLIDDSNAKQLELISDMFEDAKDDRFESEKQILKAIDDLSAAIGDKAEETNMPEISPVSEADNVINEEILRSVKENGDLLQQFAEEQIAMLIRGNSSIINQMNESIDDNKELLKEILTNTNNAPAAAVTPVMAASDNSEDILRTVANNNTLLNALRSEVAGIQGEIMNAQNKAADGDGPLDANPITKEEMEIVRGDLEEHVHKECVKVYKNVQAALEAQNANVEETVKRGTGGLKAIVIINLVLTIVNLLIAVATMLDFI